LQRVRPGGFVRRTAGMRLADIAVAAHLNPPTSDVARPD
jgi:hypothetical protein